MIRWLSAGEAPESGFGDTVTWFLRDEESLPSWTLGEQILSDDERARAAGIRHAATLTHFLRGRIVLRSAFARFGISPESKIELTAFGKPFVPDCGVHFNMSHTDGLALFAVSRIPVGVDVERSDPRRDIDGLIRRWFEPEEAAEYFALPPASRRGAFLRGWTCKEALVKALGTGVRDLGRFRVRLARPGLLAFPPGAWTLEAGELAPDLAWAVATSSVGEPAS